MLVELFNRIIDEAKPEIIEIGDVKYSTKKIMPVKERPSLLTLNTLEGISEYINLYQNKYKEIMVKVDSPTRVSVNAWDADFGEFFPVCLASCIGSSVPFRFGEKYDVTNFIIKLQADFIESNDKTELLKLVSSLTNGTSQTNEDDGVSQKVTVKTGITLKGEKVINPRVSLAPYRTFQEIEQPFSTYIFRVYSDGDVRVALYEAEGYHWQYTAIHEIKAYLDRLTTVPVMC